MQADVPEFARDVLHPGMTAMLMAHRERSWRMQGDALVVHHRRAHQTPSERDAALGPMTDILAQVLPHVWPRIGGSRLRRADPLPRRQQQL